MEETISKQLQHCLYLVVWGFLKKEIWRNVWKIIAKLHHYFKPPAIMLSSVLC